MGQEERDDMTGMYMAGIVPDIGGGSTSAEGPKNDGRSLLVVTGVLRSPGLSLSQMSRISSRQLPLQASSSSPFL